MLSLPSLAALPGCPCADGGWLPSRLYRNHPSEEHSSSREKGSASLKLLP